MPNSSEGNAHIAPSNPVFEAALALRSRLEKVEKVRTGFNRSATKPLKINDFATRNAKSRLNKINKIMRKSRKQARITPASIYVVNKIVHEQTFKMKTNLFKPGFFAWLFINKTRLKEMPSMPIVLKA